MNIPINEQLEPGFTMPVLDHGFVKYVMHMGTDHDIAAAARVSYQKHDAVKTPEDDARLIARLYRDRHTSPFEMVKIVFNIKMPIFVMRQFVRHRMQNLNEVSARYSKLPDEFYIPVYDAWREQDVKNKQTSSRKFIPYIGNLWATEHVRTHCKQAYVLYEQLLLAGVAREMARFVLPVNIYTEIRCCWDLKNLLHFFTLRDDPHAQWEHQQYGKVMKLIAAALFPVTLDAYERYKFTYHDMVQESL